MLGGEAYWNAHFGSGNGPIFMDNVRCTTSLNQLLECPSRPILSHNCHHSADAGVGCEGVLSMQLVSSRKAQLLLQMLFPHVTYSSMYNWSATTGRR